LHTLAPYPVEQSKGARRTVVVMPAADEDSPADGAATGDILLHSGTAAREPRVLLLKDVRPFERTFRVLRPLIGLGYTVERLFEQAGKSRSSSSSSTMPIYGTGAHHPQTLQVSRQQRAGGFLQRAGQVETVRGLNAHAPLLLRASCGVSTDETRAAPEMYTSSKGVDVRSQRRSAHRRTHVVEQRRNDATNCPQKYG